MNGINDVQPNQNPEEEYSPTPNKSQNFSTILIIGAIVALCVYLLVQVVKESAM